MLYNDRLRFHVFLALLMAIFLLPVSSAGLLEISINNSGDLITSEDETIIQEGTNLNLYVKLKGTYREPGNNNTVEAIIITVNFRNLDDPRDSLIGYPEFQPLCDTCEDKGYDEYLSKFRSSDTRFNGYDGIIEFDVILKNNSGNIVKSAVVEITLDAKKAESSDSGGFSIPELPPAIEDNLILIVIGFLVVLILSVGIYTFVLAPEDTTADLYKPVESVDPLKKSLTGVGYESELPGKSKKLNRLQNDDEDDEEEEDEEEYEYDDEDDDDSDFDERKILDELTGSHSINSGGDEDSEDEEETKAAPVKKKAVKKRIAKKSITKKIVKKPSTRAETTEPEVNMGKGIMSITCPSCATVHNVDENTPKFICSCGRRIRT